jgi:hypothetical protein
LDPKLAVHTSAGAVELGYKITKLADESSYTFNAQTFKGFCAYLEKNPGAWKIFYNKSAITAYKDGIANNLPLFQRYPDADCPISLHPALMMMKEMNRKKLELDSLLLQLEQLKDYCDAATWQFTKSLRTFKAEKLKTFKRESDTRTGNYQFSYKLESGGQGDFIAPETLKFTLPVFDGFAKDDSSNKIGLEFQVQYTVKEEEGIFTPIFVLSDFSLQANIETAIDALLNAKLGEAASASKQEYLIYYGNVIINRETDKWKYQESKVQL